MKTKAKLLGLLMVAVLLVTTSIFGTMAYLTSQDEVVNTFTVGSVGITLDEAPVDKNGAVIENEARVKGNKYHLIPGHNYIKDPTIHIADDSEEAYLFVTLKVEDNTDLVNALNKYSLSTELTELLNGLNNTKWTGSSVVDGTSRIYTFTYNEKISGRSEDIVLFTGFTVPDDFTKEDLETLDQFKLTVKAYAVQADGFASAEDAWTNTFGK